MTAPLRSDLLTLLVGVGGWKGRGLEGGTGKREQKRKWGLEKEKERKKEIWPGEIW